MKSAAGLALPTLGVSGTWQHAATIGKRGWALRITRPGFASPSGYASSRFNPGNLSAPGFETLYLALGRDVALREKRAVFGDPSGTPPELVAGSRLFTSKVIDVDVDLRSVVDLTDVTSHGLLGTSAQELTGDWEGYGQRASAGPSVVLNAPVGPAPTQDLGRELFGERGVEGVKYISAKVPVTCCLVVFTHKLQRPGSISWHDPNTGQRESYP